MSPELFNLFQTSLLETLWMVGVSAALGTLLGLPIGVLLVVTDRQGLLEHLPFNRILGVVANAVRSTPFIILLVAVIPFTRWVVGTSIGTAAAIVPLTIAAIPFIASATSDSFSPAARASSAGIRLPSSSRWPATSRASRFTRRAGASVRRAHWKRCAASG